MAQARALACALDDAGDVGHDEADAVLHIDNPQVGKEGGEVVVGDLGLCPADHAEKGALAHVGEADEPHVREELQLQDHVVPLPREAALGEAGGLPGGGGEVGVAPAALAAAAEDEGLVSGHVLDDLVCLRVPDQGAPGNPDGEGFAVLAAFALALAVHAGLGRIFALVAEVHEGGEVVVHLQDDVAAAAAVAAVGSPGGDVFLPVEGDAPVPAVPGPHRDPCFVDECCRHRVLLCARTGRFCIVCPQSAVRDTVRSTASISTQTPAS